MRNANGPDLLCCTILYITIFSLLPILVKSSNTITATKPLPYGQTIVSSGDLFELGFFSPGNSNWYVGIWYKNISDKVIVWVANRDNPLTNSSNAILTISDGNIVILNQSSSIIWSSNQTEAVNNPVAELLDNGNFVLRDENDEPDYYLWQGFDYPTDTLLPNMKLGWDFNRGLDRYITSWKSDDDPSTGSYSFKLNPHGFPELFLWDQSVIIYRSGPWNGLRFSGVPEMEPSNILVFNFETNQTEVYYSFSLEDKFVPSRLVVNSSGVLQRLTWIETSELWNPYWYAPKDQCDDYRECGQFGICDTNDSPVCNCLKGFEPKNQQAWNLRDGSDGCVRKVDLDCLNDGFLLLRDMKLPESSSSKTYVNKNMSLVECEGTCKRNCSCTAYANMEITGGGTGCVYWTGELMDMRDYAEGGQDLYVRLAASELGGGAGTHSDNSNRKIKIAGITVGIGIILCGLSACLLWKKKPALRSIWQGQIKQKGVNERSQDLLFSEVVISGKREYPDESNTDDLELPLFDFGTIAMATDNFSESNKLGQGGFGRVYKGILLDGQVIAVKRLSKTSVQGNEEFKNEVRLIARLQHRNLVRLLGCSIEMDEKMLIYEYMQHKSLDSIIFSKEKGSLLNWQRRFNIICGIARGLLYLHQDSRFKIIHRDLKASNILLDGEMNPKISDFGMARIFSREQIEANTRRIVGTYGYMAPEYAMDGLFSMKSDVFSFGVLVLEIVSGNKNRGFYYADNELNLLAYVWKLWKENKGVDLIDPSAGDSYSVYEVLRCIQIGLLCVQEQAEDRPSMSSVVLMLGSETATMPQPKSPGFSLRSRNNGETDSSTSKPDETFTINQVTVTMLDAR